MILEADNIELSFENRKILRGIYIKAEIGKVTGILGRNGCGKTSLLRIIFGNLAPKYKSIRKDGKHQKQNLYRSNEISYLPQHQLLPNTIKLASAFKLYGVQWVEFLTLFDAFEGYANAYPNALSTGELRIVETYLILSSDKKIILLDEPFSFIAPIYIEKFKTLIQKKKKDSVIIATDHFYHDILEVSDCIYFLQNGYSKEIRTKQDLEEAGYINPDQGR